MTANLSLEQQVAITAVRRACKLTTSAFDNLVKGETLVKGDKSPVTVADFSAQAVINTILARAFPADPIIGEEDASDLHSNTLLRERVIDLANEVLEDKPQAEEGENEDWGLGRRWGGDELLAAIDKGNYEGGRTGRMWTLDPIDGTKGFLRGGQYAVCLALLIDARVELGVIGCPNLPLDPSNPDGSRGALFVALRGQGTHQLPLFPPFLDLAPIPLRMRNLEFSQMRFLESVESAHAALDTNARVAEILGVKQEPARMDSQAKYGALARGDDSGGVYLRLPTGVGYREKIWDHAPGALLIEEAGGIVTDSRGQPLDFGLGRTLGENFGVVAAGKNIHAKIIDAIRRVTG